MQALRNSIDSTSRLVVSPKITAVRTASTTLSKQAKTPAPALASAKGAPALATRTNVVTVSVPKTNAKPKAKKTATAAAAVTRPVIPVFPKVPPPTATIKDPSTFLTAISTPRRDIAANSTLSSLLGTEWSKVFLLSSTSLKQAGIPVKERKYFLWAREKFRQGCVSTIPIPIPTTGTQEGDEGAKVGRLTFAAEPKPKKLVRGWGPRLQIVNGTRFRVRGTKRNGERAPPARP